MLIDLAPLDSRPVFRQIADEVQRCVSVGILKPGESLPAVRELAAELKVNANTVQHAYKTLAAEGTVEVRRGLGTYVLPPARESRTKQAALARRIAERMLREAFKHGLLASDLIAALQEIRTRSS